MDYATLISNQPCKIMPDGTPHPPFETSRRSRSSDASSLHFDPRRRCSHGNASNSHHSSAIIKSCNCVISSNSCSTPTETFIYSDYVYSLYRIEISETARSLMARSRRTEAPRPIVRLSDRLDLRRKLVSHRPGTTCRASRRVFAARTVAVRRALWCRLSSPQAGQRRCVRSKRGTSRRR